MLSSKALNQSDASIDCDHSEQNPTSRHSKLFYLWAYLRSMVPGPVRPCPSSSYRPWWAQHICLHSCEGVPFCRPPGWLRNLTNSCRRKPRPGRNRCCRGRQDSAHVCIWNMRRNQNCDFLNCLSLVQSLLLKAYVTLNNMVLNADYKWTKLSCTGSRWKVLPDGKLNRAKLVSRFS